MKNPPRMVNANDLIRLFSEWRRDYKVEPHETEVAKAWRQSARHTLMGVIVFLENDTAIAHLTSPRVRYGPKKESR